MAAAGAPIVAPGALECACRRPLARLAQNPEHGS
jgi:hypothetical protein